MSAHPRVAPADLSAKLAELTRPRQDVGVSLLASATYDGDRKKAVLKFYDQNEGRFWLWEDNTGHRPYCFTRLSMEELDGIRGRKDVVEVTEEEKLDLLNDARVRLRKIVTTDPLAIGGGNDSIRDAIRAWEADIKYYENFAYDRGLRMGTYYRVSQGNVIPVKHEVQERVSRSLEEVTSRNPKEFQPYLRDWAELLSEPLVDFRRAALDIEVDNEAGRLPDPEDPKQPVIAVSFFDGKEALVFLLRGKREAVGLEKSPFAYEVFEDEADLLRAVYSKIMDYPVIVSFNGDDFDLRYLQHRAEALGIREEENPIQLERVAASLKHGIHIDLYQFFRNRSIQVYAFGNRYTEHTLNAISEALLNRSKIDFDGEIGDLPLAELARYCLNDSQLTYELTSMMGSVVMKLLLVISRIGKMPMNDVSRLGVSNWIRSLLFFEHRKIGALIPRQDELTEKGGASSQAIIKGKKYKGGFVIEPKPGVYFDVSVLDFASLVFDESIFVRKRQTGQIYKTKIGEFVEGRLPPGEGFAAEEIGPTWDVLSFDYRNQGASWKTITAVIRHPNQPEVLELVTESGRRVRITEGHSVIALDSEGRKKTMRGRDLKAGDYLIALSSFAAPQSDSRLDLLPHLRQLREYDITRGAGGHGSTVILRSRRSRRRLILPRYITLTPEMMWGLGYWLAEGWHAENNYREALRIEASTRDIELARSKLTIAGFETWVAPSKSPGCSNLGVGKLVGAGGSVPASMVAKLVVLWFGNRAVAKRIPDWAMQLPLKMKEALVDGYYRGDGYNPNEHGQYVVNGKYKVGSYSQMLVDNLMSLGLMSGLHCFSKVHAEHESYLTWSRGKETYRGTKRPPAELLVRAEHVQEFAKTPFYGSHRNSPVRYERVNRESVEEYRPAFRSFYNGNCHFEKLKEIVRVKNALPVYDISVRGSESFFNADGLLLSNSLYPSLIKVHNLSYETVNCPHPECRSNTIPDTSSWVCTKRKGIVSLVTGSLRDLRVAHYKPLTKDPSLSKDDRDLYNVVSQGLKVFLNACFTGDTFVVTREGIKNIKEVKVGDEVVNVNPQTLKAEIDRVVEVQEFQYRGDLVHFKDKRFVDLMVTPNHRILTVDHRKSSHTHTIFRTADEVYELTNVAIPKLVGGIQDDGHPGSISLLETAKIVGAFANFYPQPGVRLINWFRSLPAEQRHKIREYGKVCKYWSQKRKRLESHYRVPARFVTEEDVDAVQSSGGSVLVGEIKSAKIPVRFDALDFASLCGWFVSEGSPHLNQPKEYANGNYRGRAASITITQGYGKGNQRGVTFRSEIRGLLGRLGLPEVHDSADNKYFQVTSSVLHEWIVNHCYAEGSTTHNSSTKRIPKFVFGSKRTMESFLDSLYKGDGNRRGIRYSTKSPLLAQDLVVLTTMLGAKAKMFYDGEIFRVVFKNVSSKLTFAGSYRTRHAEKVPFDGTVYCVTTERNHTVIAGRNGRFVHVGQSYGVLGFETFAFYCLPVAEATAALGRDAITRTISKCNELGIRVLYGDTDSTYLQNPSREQIDTITRWTQNELGIELDLDKVYRYVAFSSRKKNYFGVLPDGTVDIKGLTGKKSVHGKTEILARFDDTVQFTDVSSVFEAFKAGKDVEVITVVDELNTAWVHVADATRHKVEDAYRVTTEKGRELVLSGDHSVYLIDSLGQLHHRETRLLRPGDVVVGAKYVPPRLPSSTLLVLPYLAGPVSLRDGLAYSEKPHATTGVPIPVRLPLGKELASILGFYVTEGNTSEDGGSRNNFITQSRTVNQEVCDEIDRAWQILFQRPIKTYVRDRGVNSYYLPKLHAELFARLCGGSSQYKHVPQIAFDADSDFVAAFLKAVFSGDGYGDGKRVSLASKSRRFVIGVAHLLARFDIDVSLRRFRVKGKTYHQLSVIGAYSRRLFYSRIGFFQPRFNRPVGTGRRNKELIPITTEGLIAVKGEILSRRGLNGMRRVNMDDLRYYNLSKLSHYNSVLGTLMQVADEAEKGKLVKIARMLNVRDVSYDEVVSVKKLRRGAMMYDFAVPYFERFVAGNLPTLLHNSQTPEYLKRVFYETLGILSSVKTPEDFERARADTKKLLTKMISDVKGKKVPVLDLAFTVMMGKPTSRYNGTTPQHVRAAKQLEEKGKEVKAGEIIAYVKTKNPPYVKPAELARADEIDADKYIEYAHSMFDQLLDALDFSFDEIMGATTLDLFWGS